jgi:hypothetical protein
VTGCVTRNVNLNCGSCRELTPILRITKELGKYRYEYVRDVCVKTLCTNIIQLQAVLSAILRIGSLRN